MVRKLRKGFTLVELLIVIVIIGILAAAMLLSSGSATDTAEAARIISDLRSMKSAFLMLYAASPDEVSHGDFIIGHAAMSPFLDNPSRFTIANGWQMITHSGPGFRRHYVYHDMNLYPRGVREKLAARAASVGIQRDVPDDGSLGHPYAAGDRWAIIRVR